MDLFRTHIVLWVAKYIEYTPEKQSLLYITMNFSAFGGFSGIHQFAAKFGHDAQTGAFSSATAGNMTQDIHGNRYHTSAAGVNTNHFNQNATSSKLCVLGDACATKGALARAWKWCIVTKMRGKYIELHPAKSAAFIFNHTTPNSPRVCLHFRFAARTHTLTEHMAYTRTHCDDAAKKSEKRMELLVVCVCVLYVLWVFVESLVVCLRLMGYNFYLRKEGRMRLNTGLYMCVIYVHHTHQFKPISPYGDRVGAALFSIYI